MAAAFVLFIMGIAIIAISSFSPDRSNIDHRPRHAIDRFILPKIQFSETPVSNVVTAINGAVHRTSKGVVGQYIKLDTAPTPIGKFAPNSDINDRMDLMIANYRQHEQRMVERGSRGYESARFTGQIGGPHALALRYTIQDMASTLGLDYEVRVDGIYMWRRPRQLECHAYRISPSLINLAAQQRQANALHVGVEPVVSAFAKATGITSYGFTIPTGPNTWEGELYFDKVFQHLPDLGIILAVGTPEEHATAQARLKSSGLWADVLVEPKE